MDTYIATILQLFPYAFPHVFKVVTDVSAFLMRTREILSAIYMYQWDLDDISSTLKLLFLNARLVNNKSYIVQDLKPGALACLPEAWLDEASRVGLFHFCYSGFKSFAVATAWGMGRQSFSNLLWFYPLYGNHQDLSVCTWCRTGESKLRFGWYSQSSLSATPQSATSLICASFSMWGTWICPRKR